ncbi:MULTISPECIES: CDP-alcohol phosphatidyltransferase family protein [unclassified Bifidobacterium]|uniref:CDP-alcohol phosphatidyltransferase family protein n=1 Tax=unclassified Bifidobacterium TaxID=2608897 RepID=UPI0023F920BA|nr:MULTISPECIES: CDP-alcohol phosphatidyltransferase family protein [unclassified Bifidobacterium]WEV52260.1 CDP-alcohol phosphatidyltransferase family protein [Bifidobacterium sp. ESL0704]WEV65055.1 CDP-alcohol phosphatidyltransferase family protein [Bifidobacterium sp. ESL0764]
MLEKLRPPFKRLIAPIAKLLVAVGLTANAVTVIGAVGTILVAIATGITGWLIPGSILLAILAAFDSLDGSVAALTTGGTKFGAFLDSTLDRIADWAVLVAVIIFFCLHRDWWYNPATTSAPDIVSYLGVGAALYAIMTSFVTSYARARAESVGYEAKNGIATRSDRLVIILIGMLLTGIFGSPLWLLAFILILAVLGTITVFQRIFEVRRQMKADGAI